MVEENKRRICAGHNVNNFFEFALADEMVAPADRASSLNSARLTSRVEAAWPKEVFTFQP
jgi:hypothetical protein